MFGRPVDSDDGKRDMILDFRCGFRRVKVAAGGLEEVQHRLVLKWGRIGQVDHDLCTLRSQQAPRQ